ncbi:mechanosensitive ion channel family protein [Coralloluteibacterium thermophilus]|uniref:Mechanosensitive ion channel family protein n=1 Tax=Coralloluteibacterium thermophilum TaxID=2707049 RepID=A0ABV9NKK8_9GAMM
MTDIDLAPALGWLEPYPWLQALLGLVLLFLVAGLANWLTRHVILRGLRGLAHRMPFFREGALGHHRVVDRLANVVPALVIQAGVGLVPHLPPRLTLLIQNLAQAFVFLALVLTLSAALDVVNTIYQRRPDARSKPIKGYLQLVKIILFAVCALMIVGTFMQRDVFTLLAGLGAMAAVLMLVFQNTILSLVASVQVASYDMVRVGDWIEMPSLNADGDVIDISLHTVTVQNWDKTITVIPTNKLITDTFKNWRGMSESGGRRIKRSLFIDQTSVRFLDADERRRMHRFALIDAYLDRKQAEIDAWNATLGERGQDLVNTRRVTNLGTFRAYVECYLRQHPGINQDLTLLVRQLDPGPNGLPIEIYCFTSSTAWAVYEGVQSDIFDHLLAILPEFGLRVFQPPTGADFRMLGEQGGSALAARDAVAPGGAERAADVPQA